MTRPIREERGAALILAVAFMVVVGAIGAAVLSTVNSGLSNRRSLDHSRDREYAADGAIQTAIAQVRAIPGSGAYEGPVALNPCGPYIHTLNSVKIQVDCVGAPAVTQSLYKQQNVIFSACEFSKVVAGACPASSVLIRAQINFQTPGEFANLQIQRTWVQAWSVNG